MVFKLPSFQDLSPDQEMILNLPLTGKHLITGPPGSGKTVMALHRAMMLNRAGQRPTMIVYNKVLSWYLEDTLKTEGLNGNARTRDTFLPNWFRRHYRQEIPRLPSGQFNYDWDAILNLVTSDRHPEPPKLDHLIVDEGQDFPPEFYNLVDYISSNVTIFADDNQSVSDRPSRVQDILYHAGFPPHHRLTQNHRNSRQIALVAREYYCGTEDAPPELPERTGPVPWLVHYPSLPEQVNGILRYEAAMPKAHIGVLTGKSEMQNTIHRLLTGRTKHPIQRYQYGLDTRRIRFGQPGIVLLNYQSAKGLEFDVLIMPGGESSHLRWENDVHKMATYVQTSRPRFDLRVLYSSDYLPDIVRHIPEQLFRRYVVNAPGNGS